MPVTWHLCLHYLRWKYPYNEISGSVLWQWYRNLVLTVGKKACHFLPVTASDSSEAHGHFWVLGYFLPVTFNIENLSGMSLLFITGKRKVFLVSKFIFPSSCKWLRSRYVENRAFPIQLEVIFSLELPHMKTWSNNCLHFLGCDCYCLQISLRAWGGRHHVSVTHCCKAVILTAEC